MKHLLSAVAVLMFAVSGPTAPASARSDQQWYLDFLHIPQAQAISQGEGVVVAVVDTGVDGRHPDLAANVLPGTDLVTPPASADGRVDNDGHGTGMAGLIAAHGGVLGIAPKARILPVRVSAGLLDFGSSAPAAEGIDWAVDHGAKVINLSWTQSTATSDVTRAVQRALASNVVVVAGAGNTSSSRQVGFPANLPGVLAVAGIDRNGNHAAVSVSGAEVVLAAPAVDILSTDLRVSGRTGYALSDGTSDATAIVSGVVALVRSRFPNISAAEVVHRLTATAIDRGPPGRDSDYGYGIVDPVKALTVDVPTLTPSTTAPIVTASPEGAPAGGGGSGGSGARVAVLGLLVLAVLVAVGWFIISRRRVG
jgi:type VII secretion-associated serine protease mycosin